MSEFIKYPHLERLGNDAVGGLLVGDVYAFYKIDGTNGSVWIGDDGLLYFGSRNRQLDLHNDNAGFMNALYQDIKLYDLLNGFPEWRLYGEWLVPHSLKTYRDDAWRQFYVFDVMDENGNFIPYDRYKVVLDEYGIKYIPPVAILRNPTPDTILGLLEKTGQFLVKDGEGNGEGIVLKNYNWTGRHGKQTWAKVISNEFKEQHHKVMGAPLVLGTALVEDEIVHKYVTEHFVMKEKAKIEVENGGWSNRNIPQLLGVVFHELVTEEIWNILKQYKNPTINFNLLNKLTILKVKEIIGLN